MWGPVLWRAGMHMYMTNDHGERRQGYCDRFETELLRQIMHESVSPANKAQFEQKSKPQYMFQYTKTWSIYLHVYVYTGQREGLLVL